MCGAKWGQESPSAVAPGWFPLRPSRARVAALPGRMVGTCCGSCGSAVSCKKEAAAAAAGAGGGGGEEPDLSSSEGLEANTEFPQSRPGAGRVPLPRGALPAGQMVSGAAQVVALGRECAGGLGGEAGRTRNHPSQTEGVQCPAERDPGHDKDDPRQ